MSSEQGEMSPAAPPLEDENLLLEILLRLPPQPSSLPRASAVCKHWRSNASDPAFSRRFRRHHRRNPPLLGFFCRGADGLSFVPTLEAPNRVPPGRFFLQFDNHFRLLGCRHGLALIFDRKPLQFLVWDPVTGQQHHLAIPPGFDPTKANVSGAVLCSAAAAAAGDVQHFKVVLVMGDDMEKRWLACVYSSQSGVWGNLISRLMPSWNSIGVFTNPAVLIGDSLYWELIGSGSRLNILEFDLERESLSVIPRSDDLINCRLMRAEGGGLGLLSVWGFTALLRKRYTDSDGVGSWGIPTTIELDKLLSLDPDPEQFPEIKGFAEDNNLLLLSTGVSLFTVQLDSLQFKKLPKPEMLYRYHPFESVYAAGI